MKEIKGEITGELAEIIDKHSRRMARNNELLLSIKNNVQFFFWVWIIGAFVLFCQAVG